MTKEQILQKHFTAEFGHDGHGEFMQYILNVMEEYAQQQVKNLNIPAVISRLKTDLDNWIDGCEKAAGNLRDIGHFKDAQKFDGQATAYWAVKNYLD